MPEITPVVILTEVITGGAIAPFAEAPLFLKTLIELVFLQQRTPPQVMLGLFSFLIASLQYPILFIRFGLTAPFPQPIVVEPVNPCILIPYNKSFPFIGHPELRQPIKFP